MAADARDPLVGKVLDGRFLIDERLGEGGYTVIYRATQLGVDRPIALKVLAANAACDPEWVKRFHSSARALARISDPHAVHVYDSGHTSDDFHFIAMELLPGHTLRREIDRGGPLRPGRALRILSQAAGALAAIHRSGCIHRDFKPDSVLLCEMHGERDWVEVLFSTVLKTDDPDAPTTPAGKVLGTPWYMAPEQVRGHVTFASDIYAAGITLYEMIAGYRPFEGDAVEVAIKQLKHRPPPIEGIPALVGLIMERALEKDPERRYPSAADLSADCARAADVFEE